jgi:hypothetical protein
MNHSLARWEGKRLKLFIVEMDDTERERVLSCQVEYVTIDRDVEYSTVMSDMSGYGVHRFVDREEVTLKARIVPKDDGTYLTAENFGEQPQEEDEDEYSE